MAVLHSGTWPSPLRLQPAARHHAERTCRRHNAVSCDLPVKAAFGGSLLRFGWRLRTAPRCCCTFGGREEEHAFLVAPCSLLSSMSIAGRRRQGRRANLEHLSHRDARRTRSGRWSASSTAGWRRRCRSRRRRCRPTRPRRRAQSPCLARSTVTLSGWVQVLPTTFLETKRLPCSASGTATLSGCAGFVLSHIHPDEGWSDGRPVSCSEEPKDSSQRMMMKSMLNDATYA